jgi:NAD(P)-dependent dehydrogenase (short-subunit alcohol dehydrogenase family)
MYVNSRKLKGRSRSTKQRLFLYYNPTNMTEEFPRPTRSLVGRVAIVSGAGAAGDGIGNGRASAILLAEAGCNVVCVDMKHDLAQRTAELVEEDGHGKAIAVQADVTSEDDARNVVSKTLDAFGRIDILVNVVGIGGAAGTAEDVDMVEWAKGMEVNVASMVIMAKYCLPHMAKNEGQWRGSIVNIASVAGIRGGTPHLLYPTSKGAIVVSCLFGYVVSVD